MPLGKPCVLCDSAWLVGAYWVITMTTPPECEHETIDGET